MAIRSEERSDPPRRGRRQPPARRKSCYFCKDKIEEIDYKNFGQLRRYTSEKGKIRSRRISGACRRHQRQVATAVKRAREMALLPYAVNSAGLNPRQSNRFTLAAGVSEARGWPTPPRHATIDAATPTRTYRGWE